MNIVMHDILISLDSKDLSYYYWLSVIIFPYWIRIPMDIYGIPDPDKTNPDPKHWFY